MKKLSADEIKKEIRSLDQKEAREIALSVLGKPAQDWYKYRYAGAPERLIDPTTGQPVREFTANKQKYFVRMPEDGMSLFRYTKIKEYLSVVGFDATYVDQMKSLNQIAEYVNSLTTKQPKLVELGAAIKSMQESILKTRDRNWDWSLVAATLFIVKPDEDMTGWVQSEQEKKVEDWNKAGFLHEDFFSLTVWWGYRFQQQSNELFDRAKQAAKQKTWLAG